VGGGPGAVEAIAIPSKEESPVSAATLVALPHGRYTAALRAQSDALSPAAPERLVVCCDEPCFAGASLWAPRAGPALWLRTPGARPSGAGVREAIRFAVRDLGVESLWLVAHSRCCRLLPDPFDAVACDPGRPGRPLLERMKARLARSQAQLEAARAHVRAVVQAWRTDPATAHLAVAGFVHVVESGLVMRYAPGRDEFEALL